MQWTNRFFKHFCDSQGAFLSPLSARNLPQPSMVAWSSACAASTGLARGDADWLAAMTSSQAPQGAQPCATVYSGHQFGQWAGQLGDGRALLLGEVRTEQGHFELQLKGSGRTPYSRGGDGMAVLRSSIREFLCSEAMAGLGIPTTRALALAASPQPVVRETVETAAVVLRCAPSFIRFGHFEHFAAAGDKAGLQKMADFVCEQFYPETAAYPSADERRYVALLDAVCGRTAQLISQWQAVGFCHGVMNTDNLSIVGLTLDYGPFGFLDTFDAHHICNHTDEQGRYAYARQPQVAHWNLGCLAQALSLLVIDHGALAECLKKYATTFNRLHTAAFLSKLGICEHPQQAAEHSDLVARTLQCLHEARADMTLFFRRLSHAASSQDFAPVRDICVNPAVFDAWLSRYLAACAQDGQDAQARSLKMLLCNPKYILRNHLAEAAIRKASDENDFAELNTLLQLLANPYEEQAAMDAYADLPPAWAQTLSVSCSS